MVTFGGFLKRRLLVLGLNQKAFAERLEVSTQYVNDLIRDRRGDHLSDQMIERLAVALEVNPTTLYLLNGRLTPNLREYAMNQPYSFTDDYTAFCKNLGVGVETI